MNARFVLPGAPMVNATRFRQAHEADWARLDALVTRMEKRSIRSLSDDDLLDLAGLYRTTVSSLSVARDTSLDRALIAYLEQLCTRAYFQIYGVQTPAHRQIARFFAHGWFSHADHKQQACYGARLWCACFSLPERPFSRSC